ncbi:MAG: FixH family protein [Pseudomonadota bacterium]
MQHDITAAITADATGTAMNTASAGATTTPATTQSAARPFTGYHMLAIMLTFFGVVISVNFTMAWMAGNTWTGLVVKNSYVASQNFNARLAWAREQRARGWQSNLTYRDGILLFLLTDKTGVPIDLTTLSTTLGRPAFEQSDRQIDLGHVAPGKYEARLELGLGVWSVVITGTSVDGAPYRREARISVPAVHGPSESSSASSEST